MKKEIIQYVRNDEYENNNMVEGCMVSRLSDDDPSKVLVGYAFTNPKDTYDKFRGIELVEKRMIWLDNANHCLHRVHPRFRVKLYNFLYRCQKYFRDKQFPNWVNDYMNDPKIKEEYTDFI